MKTKKTEIRLRFSREAHPVKIVADAAISTRGRQGGRLLPVLLLDTAERPDIAEFIRLHESLGPGDVKIQWGQIPGHGGTVALYLSFIRPVELFMLLEFDIVRQGILVEQALIGQGVYLAQAEGENDRLRNNIDRPKVIVEIPDTGFRKTWDREFYKYLAKDFRTHGLSRSDSKRAALSAIEELRKFSSPRMRDTHD
jgi:hypothetical protein